MQFVPLIATVVAGGLAANEQRNAGKWAEIQHAEAAEQELTAAKDREISRKQRLIEVLAVQNAEAGALGASVGFGSRAAIALTDAKRAQYDMISDRASTGRRALILRSEGREAARRGNMQAVGTLLDTAVSAASLRSG